jgi:selenide,water dikinase
VSTSVETNMTSDPSRILLVGGGHSHVEVLRRFALQPEPRAELTLVTPETLAAYSGMVPGLVAGHYTAEQSHIDLAALARWARARLVLDRLVALDPEGRFAHLEAHEPEPFDFISIDVGSTPDLSVPGAAAHAQPVKPVSRFLAAWESMQRDAAAGRLRTIVVVGGGAGGVELLLAMQHRLRSDLHDAAPRFAVVTDQPCLLPSHSPAARAHIGRALVANDVVIHLDSPVVEVRSRTVINRQGVRIAADAIVWATAAAAPPWARAAGLACDARGFIEIDNELRSLSHPFVFATGDCASQVHYPRPKSGLYAVRQGPPLAANLRHAVRGEILAPYVPQRHSLALISTGDLNAIASRAGMACAGRWVWRLKDRIDRGFVAKYRPPETPPP